jgi:hypothetical protein
MQQWIKSLLAPVFLAGALATTMAPPAQAFEFTDEEQATDAAMFVGGNAMYVMFHEIGHMLVSAYQVPVLGKEEDAVDNLAAVIMLLADSEESGKMLSNAAAAWFMSHDRSQKAGAEAITWGEHSLDIQRAYQIVCLMYGANPDRFKDVADAAELPEERRVRCAGEYEQAKTAWSSILDPHTLADGEAKSVVKVEVEAAPANMIGAEILKTMELVETSAEFVASTFRLPGPVTFRLKSCGMANAYWNPADLEVVYCYELGQDHFDLWASNNSVDES